MYTIVLPMTLMSNSSYQPHTPKAAHAEPLRSTINIDTRLTIPTLQVLYQKPLEAPRSMTLRAVAQQKRWEL